MTTDYLKLVLLFNARDTSFTVLSHNLDGAEADEEVTRLRGDELPAFSLQQQGEHQALEAETCQACASAVRSVMAKRGGKTHDEDTAA